MVNVNFSIVALLTAACFAKAVPNSLEQRDASCRDDNAGVWKRGRTSEAVECINQLASLNQACVAGTSAVLFRRCGNTVIYGLSTLPNGSNGGRTESTCKDVARGAGRIMDLCSRGDGTVMGQNAAWGNGNLLISISGA